MKNIFVFILIAIISSGCASLEYISVPMDPTDPTEWKVGFQTRPKSFGDASYIRELIPKDDNIKNWSKLVTIQYIHGKSNVAPKEFVTALINNIKKSCSDAEWSIIESSTRSIIYEWSTKECKPPTKSSSPNIFTPQHEVARIIFGNEGIHKASYNEKTKNLNPDIRDRWISVIRKSSVKKDGNIIQLQ